MNINQLGTTELFKGIDAADTKTMLTCLGCIRKQYKKGESIYHSGDFADSAGFVLTGGVYIEQTDIWGNQNILSHAGSGELFGEAYASVPGEPLMVNVVAAEDTDILFLQINKILNVCPSGCVFHSRLIKNLLAVISGKNLRLTRKINHITPKSIRGRVLAFLSDQARIQGRFTFDIPFNRQHLADYLCVERSALSKELSKMQQEGLISYHKQHFCLKTGLPES